MIARTLSVANRHPRLRLDRRALADGIALLDANAARFRGGCPAGELSLVFLTDSALAKLHATFLDDPSITDVITFAGSPDMGTAGEICVSADAALRQAGLRPGSSRTRKRLAGLSPGSRSDPTKSDDFDYSGEVLLYVVHGWLHLAGFDDRKPAKKRTMRRAEARAMKLLTPLARRHLFRLIK
jgi:probable rRNA maturation factor